MAVPMRVPGRPRTAALAFVSPSLLLALVLVVWHALSVAAAAIPYDPWFYATPTAFDQWTSRYDVGLTPLATADGTLHAVGGVVRPTPVRGQSATLSLAGDSWTSADGINWQSLGPVTYANGTAVWPSGRAGMAVLPIDSTVIAFGGYDALTSDGSQPVLQGGTWIRDKSAAGNVWSEVASPWFTDGTARPTALTYAVSTTEQLIWLYAGRGVNDLWRYTTASGWQQIQVRAINDATTLGLSGVPGAVVLNSGTGFSTPQFAVLSGTGERVIAWALNITFTPNTTTIASALWMPVTPAATYALQSNALVVPANGDLTDEFWALPQSATPANGAFRFALSFDSALRQWSLSQVESAYNTLARTDTAFAQFRDVVLSVGGSADVGFTAQRWDVVIGYLVTDSACGKFTGNALCHYPGAYCVAAAGNSTLSACVAADWCTGRSTGANAVCANGGVCGSVVQPNATASFMCTCADGYTGATCSEATGERAELDRWIRMLPTWVALPIGAALLIALVVVSAVLCAKTCECCKRKKDRKSGSNASDSDRDKDPNSQPDAATHGGTTQAPGEHVQSRSATDSTASNSSSISGGSGPGSNWAAGYGGGTSGDAGDSGLPPLYPGDLARLPPHTAMVIRAEPQATVPLRYSAIEMDTLKAQVSRRFDVLFAQRQASLLQVYSHAETRFKAVCGNKPPPPTLLGLTVSPVAMPRATPAS